MNLWNSLWFLYTQILVFTFSLNFSASYLPTLPIPVAARCKAWDCGRWLDGIAGSNPAEHMDVCLLWVLCFVRQITRPEESYRLTFVLIVISERRQWRDVAPLRSLSHGKRNYTARRFGWLPCEQHDRYRHVDLLCRQQKVFCVRMFHGEQYGTWVE